MRPLSQHGSISEEYARSTIAMMLPEHVSHIYLLFYRALHGVMAQAAYVVKARSSRMNTLLLLAHVSRISLFFLQGPSRGHDPTHGSGQGVFKLPRVGSGQEGFEISRGGRGRVTLTRPDPTREFSPTREQPCLVVLF